jgi:hypothetical protein
VNSTFSNLKSYEQDDYYRVNAPAGSLFNIKITYWGPTDYTRFYVQFYDSSQFSIGSVWYQVSGYWAIYPVTCSGTSFYIQISNYNCSTFIDTTYSIETNQVADDGYEPNQNLGQATTVNVGDTITGLRCLNDDWYKITSPPGMLTFNITRTAGGSYPMHVTAACGNDFYVAVGGSSGGQIYANVSSTNWIHVFSTSMSDEGTYTLSSTLTPDDAFEDNDVFSSPYLISLNTDYQGVLMDNDYYQFAGVQNVPIDVVITPTVGLTTTASIYIQNLAGTTTYASGSFWTTGTILTFIPAYTGNFLVLVQDPINNVLQMIYY